MAILNTSQGEVEVRIKRYPDHTCYDEYIKAERKELVSDVIRTRYIIAEPDTLYYIEITLKPGFDFGGYDAIDAKLYFSDPGKQISSICFWQLKGSRKLKESIVRKIQYADVEVDGEKVLGARFSFRSIEMDETLSDETDVMGIHPDSLVTFSVKLYLYKKHTVTLSDDEHNKAVLEFQHALAIFERNVSALEPQDGVIDPAVIQPNNRNLWDAEKVDIDSYKKRGINSAIGFSGGKKQPNISSRGSMCKNRRMVEPQPPGRVITSYTTGSCSGIFEFHCRAAEFLELAGIIKYPPPLHCYSWAILNDNERKTALAELQELSKRQWHEDREKETGLILPMAGSRIKSEDDPWEWRHWDKMYAAEKQKAFVKLQTDKKDRQRGIIQRQYKSMMGRIISLDENDDRGDKNELKNELDNDGSRINDIPDAKVIKDEKSDLDKQGNAVPQANDYILNSAPKSDGITAGLSDEDLSKKEAAVKKLEEDIAHEDRIQQMKRERDNLQEKIDAARSKKRSRRE